MSSSTHQIYEEKVDKDRIVQNDNCHEFQPFHDHVVNPGWRTSWDREIRSNKTIWCGCVKLDVTHEKLHTKTERPNKLKYDHCICCWGLCYGEHFEGFDGGCGHFCCCNSSHCICGHSDRAYYESCLVCGTGEVCAVGTEGGCGLSLCGLGCFFGQMIRSLRLCGHEYGYKRDD